MRARQAAQIRRGIELARLNYPRFDPYAGREPWLVFHAWSVTVTRLSIRKMRDGFSAEIEGGTYEI